MHEYKVILYSRKFSWGPFFAYGRVHAALLHTHTLVYFVGLIFLDWQLTVKTAKIDPMKIICYTVYTTSCPDPKQCPCKM